MEHYQQIMDKGKRAIDAVVSGQGHTEKDSRDTMLKLLLELRIFCNQGTYTNRDHEREERSLDADEHLTLLEEREEAFCACCFSTVALINQTTDPSSGILGHCSHVLCSLCYEEVAVNSGLPPKYTCPVCDEVTHPRGLRSAEDMIGENRASKHSSKLNVLIEDLLLSRDSAIPEKR